MRTDDVGAERSRIRRITVVLMVVVGTLSFTFSAVGWWARRNVANTDVWLERVGPLAEDPDVRAALGAWLSDEVIDLIDPGRLLADALSEVLPDRGRILAVPLTGAVEQFIRDRIDHFLASDRFAHLWREANETVHAGVIRVLRGESDVVSARGNRVVIDLVPAIDAALADIGKRSPQVFGREIDLPTLTTEDLPAGASARLEQALGVDLDDDFGRIVVYDGGRLAGLQRTVDQARRLLVVLSFTTVAALAGALWLSDRRRRTLLQVLAGLAIGLTLIRRLALRSHHELLAAIADDVNRAAADAASHRFLDPLLAVTQTLLVALAVVALVVVLTGPYPWAVRLRQGAVRSVRRLGDPDTTEWIRAHRGPLQVGGVVLAVAILLFVDVPFAGVVLLGVALAAGELAVARA